MAWPCPRCRAMVERYDGGHDTRDLRPEEAPDLTETEGYRSYGCRCGWSAITVETVILENPETLRIRGRYTENSRPRAVVAGVTCRD